MPTTEENTARVRGYDWLGLRELWSEIAAGATADWGSGMALEFLVLRAFELDGADVAWPYNVSSEGKTIGQIDGVVYTSGIAALIECKDYGRAVNFEPIAKLRQQLHRRPPSTIGCCFARNGITDEALLLTQRNSPQNVLIWQGNEIAHSLEAEAIGQALVAKYRRLVEHAVPDFDITAL